MFTQLKAETGRPQSGMGHRDKIKSDAYTALGAPVWLFSWVNKSKILGNMLGRDADPVVTNTDLDASPDCRAVRVTRPPRSVYLAAFAARSRGPA